MANNISTETNTNQEQYNISLIELLSPEKNIETFGMVFSFFGFLLYMVDTHKLS
jgi:hypothetical protein